MKHTTLLSLAGILGAATLAISQPSATEPTPGPTPVPQVSPGEAGPSPSGDTQKACGFGRFGKHRAHGWEHRRGRGGYVEMLDRLLNLTDEQKEKVKEIVKVAKPKIQAIMAEERAKVRAVTDETRQQIRSFLTPAQQKVLDDALQLREGARKLKEDAKNLRQESGEQS